jgi:TonB family protein
MKKIICLGLLCIALNSYAQTDTIFLNYAWKPCLRSNATYYRLNENGKGLLNIKHYTMQNKLFVIGNYSSFNPDVRDGAFNFYDDSSDFVTSKHEYVNGKKIKHTYYYKNSTDAWIVWIYKNNLLHGKTIGYYPNGKIKRMEEYKKGILEKGNCYTQNGADTTYYSFEIMPQYPGGEGEMTKFLREEIKYPIHEKDNDIQGTVYLQFNVESTGEITNIKVFRGVKNGSALDNEAVRVIKLFPKWKPALQDGEPTRVKYNLPIKFSLN